jgi:uncharacterized membrane protein YbhN (UPF0104 family)
VDAGAVESIELNDRTPDDHPAIPVRPATTAVTRRSGHDFHRKNFLALFPNRFDLPNRGHHGAVVEDLSDAVVTRATDAQRHGQSRWVQVVVSLGVVALIFGFLFPKLADYDQVWDTVDAMSTWEVIALCGVALANLVGYLPLVIAVLPGLRVHEAAVSNLASTAISNTLPGGSALGVGVTVSIQRSFGIPTSEIALGAVISGIWNNFAKLALPVLALALLAASGEAGAGLVGAAIVGVVVLVACVALFALLLRSEALARSLGTLAQRVFGRLWRLVRRPQPRGWAEGAVRFRRGAIGLLRGRALVITLATVLNNALLYLVLLVAVRVVGVSNHDLSWVKILAGYAFVRLLSAVPVTPGGLGVVELGLTAYLRTGLDTTAQNQVAAAVLLYRALTWFAPIPLGTAAWILWRSKPSWRMTVEQRRHRRLPPETESPAAS